MKKIISRHQREKKQNIKQWAVGIVLIIVIIVGIVGGSFQRGTDNDNTNKIEYNDFEFVGQGDYWILSLNNENFIFNYNPEEVERVEGNLNSINNYYNKPLYIFSENNNAEAEIYQNLFYYNKLVQRMQKACPEDEKCAEDIPTKNCEDNFIIIKESDLSRIYQQENCVFIEGKQEDLLKLTDEFLFKILGIS